jgi:hypothetical protein
MEGHFGRPRHACIKGVLNTDGVRGGEEGREWIRFVWLRVGSGVELLRTGF